MNPLSPSAKPAPPPPPVSKAPVPPVPQKKLEHANVPIAPGPKAPPSPSKDSVPMPPPPGPATPSAITDDPPCAIVAGKRAVLDQNRPLVEDRPAHTRAATAAVGIAALGEAAGQSHVLQRQHACARRDVVLGRCAGRIRADEEQPERRRPRRLAASDRRAVAGDRDVAGDRGQTVRPIPVVVGRGQRVRATARPAERRSTRPSGSRNRSPGRANADHRSFRCSSS